MELLVELICRVHIKVAGLPLSPYYTQIIRLSEDAQSLTEVIVAGEEHGSMSKYIDSSGSTQDIYNGTEESELVKKYFYMEYNRLQKADRLDGLFDP